MMGIATSLVHRYAFLSRPARLISLVTGVLLVGIGLFLVGTQAIAGMSWLALGALLVVTAFVPLNRLALLGMTYAMALLAFMSLRGLADDLLPVHYSYVIEVERILFAGTLPSEWLQENIYASGEIRSFDLAMGGVYFTHFINTHLVVLLIMITRRDVLPRFVAAFLVMLAGALLVHVMVPTAPPWLASETGKSDADVHRIVAELTTSVEGGTYMETAKDADNNLFAAMPSLHAGFAALVALVLIQYGRWQAGLGTVYVVLMCISLTYLGEHYVIDELAGIALAYGAWRVFAPKMSYSRYGIYAAMN